MDKLFTMILALLPQHFLSRIVGRLACSHCKWIKMPFMRWFAWQYQVDLSEAEQSDLADYDSFNAFFTRPLKPGSRMIPVHSEEIISPVDGGVSQIGDIDSGDLLQAKGKTFTVLSLLGGDEESADAFAHGSFATLYLAPKDYHRVHMPFDGKLTKMICVPGKLFSVNEASVKHVDQLFARNERVACLFETAHGPMAVVFVGAMIVASIKVNWAGVVMPSRPRKIQTVNYHQQNIIYKKGDDVGQFLLGSTVIVLFANQVEWLTEFTANKSVKMGQTIATIHKGKNVCPLL